MWKDSTGKGYPPGNIWFFIVANLLYNLILFNSEATLNYKMSVRQSVFRLFLPYWAGQLLYNYNIFEQDEKVMLAAG